ncbi:MAG: hypothetical protein R3C02_25465 [Planctomycetaceae bacterium]
MLAFIHIEKAAGTTITTILRQSFGLGHCDLASWHEYRQEYATPSATDLHRALLFYPRLKSISGHIVVPHCGYEQICPGIRYYTFLREPLKRCASHYQHQVQTMDKEPPPFEEWIQQEVYHNFITKKLATSGRAEDAIETLESRVGCTGLVERFDESLLLLRRWANLPELDIRYQRQNVAPRDEIKNELLWNASSRQAIIDTNQEDLELYNHVVKELFPRQLAEYGAALESDLEAFRNANTPPRLYPGQLPSFVFRHAIYRPAARLTSALHRAA